jgi:crooked neck
MSRSNHNDSGQVKNRAPAPIQISAEQILREAADRQESITVDPVVQIHDAEEYQSYLRDRRKHFEDNIRYRREHIGNWVKYAKLEEEHKEFDRARSIFERALEVEPRSAELWLRYAEFEMRNEFVNHARNILDRAVQLLPRVDFLWYKYVYMEELVRDVPKCRAVFERWMKWMPDDNAWLAYARFETRRGGSGGGSGGDGAGGVSMDRAEAVMRRYVNAYPSTKAFLKFSKWAEYEARNIDLARTILEACLSELEPEESKQARVFQRFAAFEERQGEYERARVIYQHSVKLLRLGDIEINPQQVEKEEDITEWEVARRQELYKSYLNFEKQHGDRKGIERVLLTKQRREYNERVQRDPHDYDAWFEFAKLEEDYAAMESGDGTIDGGKSRSRIVGDPTFVRDVYERAVAQIPPLTSNKEHWKRYIYLWIYYATYEELTNHDLDRAAEIYQTCLNVIPHKQFTFAKIWIYSAKAQVRKRNLPAARKILGRAIGLCGKDRIFREYISLELSLGEIDRCRSLYNNYLKAMPQHCEAWTKYAELEKSLGETDRCRAILELAISQASLDMPEVLWKTYIDFEIDEGEGDHARRLYERLLERTSHVKVWISYGQFEASEIGLGMKKAREALDKAYDLLKEDGLKEERVLLLDAWRGLEQDKGDANSVTAIEKRLPRRIKRKRMRKDDDGNDLGWEEYFDYQFPDDNDEGTSNLKILEMAAKWKRQRLEASNESDDDDDESDDED